jgi:hypothetical protein
MTESTCLHIQDRESGPIRVVELPGNSVRIGRAPHCEIQLTELGPAEEVCRLLRRGRTWQLVPNGKGSPIKLGGRSISGCSLVPFDVPFFVGSYCLTLRHDRTAEPDWENYGSTVTPRPERTATLISAAGPADERPKPKRREPRAPETPQAVDRVIGVESKPKPTRDDEAAPLVEKQVDRPGEEARPHAARKESASPQDDAGTRSLRERWETRWRAVSAEIKARAQRGKENVEPLKPDNQTRHAVPLREPSVPRLHPVPPPLRDLPIRPESPRSPSRVELSFTPPKAEPSREFTPAEVAGAHLKAAPASPRIRPEPARDLPASWAEWLAKDQPPVAARRREQPAEVTFRSEGAPYAPETVQASPPSKARVDDGASALQRSARVDVGAIAQPLPAASGERTSSGQPGASADRCTDPVRPQAAANVGSVIDQQLPVEAARTIADQPALPEDALVAADEPPAAVLEERDEPALVQIPAIDAYVAEMSHTGGQPPPPEPVVPPQDQPVIASEAIAAKSRVEPPEEPPPAPRSRVDALPPRNPPPSDRRDVVPRAQPADRLAGAIHRDPARNVEWPSASDILATHRATPKPRPLAQATRNKPGRKSKSVAIPTLARQPGHWSPPLGLVGPPAAVLFLAAGIAGCFCSLRWASDAYAATVITERLLTKDRSARGLPLPDSVSPPDGSWVMSTSGHLARRAIVLGYFQGERSVSPEQTAGMLEAALQASPLDREARLALAQLEPSQSGSEVSIRSLGLSRDAVSLTFTARRLLSAGRKEAALAMYGRALAAAVPENSSRTAMPWFSDDPGVPRYLLPGEQEAREILRDLVTRSELRVSDWSNLLPDSPVLVLAAARLLREQGSSEADSLLERLDGDLAANTAAKPATATALAARAEASALKSRWRDADRLYREAIELVSDETIRRSWWLNLADVAFRLEDDDKRQAALRAAMAVAASDDIRRRAADIQRSSRPAANLIRRGVKAN